MNNVELFYTEIEANYNDVKDRFKDDDRIIKFLKMFLNEDNLGKLLQSFNNDDIKEAFRYSHTLKGITRELSLTKLNSMFITLTDLLRDGNIKDEQEAKVLLDKTKDEYLKTEELFNNLIGN